MQEAFGFPRRTFGIALEKYQRPLRLPVEQRGGCRHQEDVGITRTMFDGPFSDRQKTRTKLGIREGIQQPIGPVIEFALRRRKHVRLQQCRTSHELKPPYKESM